MSVYDPTSLGNLARVFGACSEAHVAAALQQQAHNPSMRIGACLVTLGALTPDAVQWLITKQVALRHAPSGRDVARLLDFAVERLGEETAKVAALVRELSLR